MSSLCERIIREQLRENNAIFAKLYENDKSKREIAERVSENCVGKNFK
jgi:hypothetical protein